MRETRKVVTCKHCEFERVVDAGETVGPVDLLFHHGRQTGHRLRVKTIE